MRFDAHAITAAPFLFLGMPFAAVGAIAPDLTWIANELRFRKSPIHRWSEWIDTIPEQDIEPYRWAHSLLVVAIVAVVAVATQSPMLLQFCAGWAVHIMIDLPTHSGRMMQQPLYPFEWRWKWIHRRWQ